MSRSSGNRSDSPARPLDSTQRSPRWRESSRNPETHRTASRSQTRTPSSGDYPTNRIAEPIPLNAPYGVSSRHLASNSGSLFLNRSSTTQFGGADSGIEHKNVGRDRSRGRLNLNTHQTGLDRRATVSAVPSLSTHDQDSTRNFGVLPLLPDLSSLASSSRAAQRLESILDESRPRTTARTPSLDNDKSPPMSSNAIYERQLLQKKHGFPLWVPHPNLRLPQSYIEKGVSVGDVGIITSQGAFDYLFNVCLPAEHPNNAGSLPEGFVPLLTQQKDICEFPEHSSSSYLSSASVKKLSGLSFQSTDSEGAVLTMPEGAYHEDIRNLSKFREYAAFNAQGWYKFANGPCGREIENGELHLVTGCDKAASWGMATFAGNSTTAGDPIFLKFVFDSDADGCICSWECTGNAEVKASPDCREAAGTRLRNQCTFIRSHTITLSDDEWAKVQASINVQNGDASETNNETGSTKSSSNSRNTLKRFFSSFGPKGYSLTQRSQQSAITKAFLDAPSRTPHPASIVNKVLLQKCPQARVAVTHDDDWAILAQERLPSLDVADLWVQIKSKFDVAVDTSGTVYLSLKESIKATAEAKSRASSLNDVSAVAENVTLLPSSRSVLEDDIEESDYTVETLIQILTTASPIHPAHARLLIKRLSVESPPPFSTLQPVIARLCSPDSPSPIQGLGFQTMVSYWENPKVQGNECDGLTTSDALSCLTFFLDSPTRWNLELGELRFRALTAITKDGTEIQGVETVVLDIVKRCLSNAFNTLIQAPAHGDSEAESECQRCIARIGKFLSDILGHRNNVARIREEVLMDIFRFYGNLIDELVLLPSAHPNESLLSPLDFPTSPTLLANKPARRGHKKRASSLSSIMFLSSPINSTTQVPSSVTPSKHPAEVAISLYLDHVSAHLLHLSSEQLWVVLPPLFEALAFCASPLPRLTLHPQPIKPTTLEERIVDLLNTLVPSPSSITAMRILKHSLFPSAPSYDSIVDPSDKEDPSVQHKLLNAFQLMIMTALGACRTLRNYVRRALAARLENVYHPQDMAIPRPGAPGRIVVHQDLMDIAWIRYEHSLAPAKESKGRAESRTLARSIEAWVNWAPDFPDSEVHSSQNELWERIADGKENILEEGAGILKDIYQEFDVREEDALDVDESELDPINDALRSLSSYIPSLQSPDGTPFIVNAFHPGDAPTPLLRSIATLLSRDFSRAQKPLLADILIGIAVHVTDENTARIPSLLMEYHDLTPMSSSWLDNWEQILDPRLLSSNKPQTRRAIIGALHSVYDSIEETEHHRKALSGLVIRSSSFLIRSQDSDPVFAILEDEAVWLVVEGARDGEGISEDIPAPIHLLNDLVFGQSDDDVAISSIRTLIHIFSHLSFTSLSFQQHSQRVAVSIFLTFLKVLTDVPCIRTRLIVLQFIMRLRADREHRVYFALEGYDTNGLISYLASLINRMPNSLMSSHRDEILDEHVARTRQARSRMTQYRGASASQSQQTLGEMSSVIGRGRSRTILVETGSAKPHIALWQLPESLSFKPVEPDSIKNGLISYDAQGPSRVVVLPVSKYLQTLAVLIETEASWELVSYILCHLPVQLANKHLFCGPNARASITKLLYILSTGVISRSLASQTADDCPEELKLRDLQGLAHHTLSTLISYKSYFDLQQRQLLIEAFQSGLDGPFSTIKCCLHALSLSAYELSSSLSKSLPKIMEKLSQIMSNPNMAVHILAFLVIVGNLPSLHASFTEDDFKMVFGVALQYLQHYNQLRESPTRSWALSQHVRQQSYVTVYTWFSVLKVADRQLHIPYIVRQLMLANEGKGTVDGLTQVCFDWLARNTHGVANACKTVSHDIVLQPNIAKPAQKPFDKVWLFGNSFLSVRSTDRPGWVEVMSRRPSGSTSLVCRKEDFIRVSADHGPNEIVSYFSGFGSEPCEPDQSNVSDRDKFKQEEIMHSSLPESGSDPESQQLSFASQLFFHLTQISDQHQEIKDVTNVASLPKTIGVLDRLPVIDTHKVGIMYVGPGQTNEIDILRNSHGSQAYTRFLDGIGRLIRIRTEKDVYTGSLDPDEDGEYAYAWWDDIRQILFHTATLMPTHEHDPMQNYKKRHIGNDYVRIVWNDSGLPYRFDTLATAFQFVNIVVEPHSVGTISAFSDDTHENEYFRVTVQTASGMTECTPVGQFKIVSAVVLPQLVRQLSIFTDCFTDIFASTDHDTQRVEIKTNWNARLDSMQRFKKQIPGPEAQPVPPDSRAIAS